jgi:hypothetical protein
MSFVFGVMMAIAYTPDRPWEEALAQLRSDLEAWSEALHGDEQTMWKEWSGDRFSSILRTPHSTLVALGDSNPLVRLTAVSIVRCYWRPSTSFAGECLRLAFDDPDARVRGAAFLVVSFYAFLNLIVDTTKYLQRLSHEVLEPLPEHIRQKAQVLLTDSLKKQCAREQRFLHTVKELTGVHFEEMLSSSKRIAQCLASEDRNLRLAAIWLVAWYWAKDHSFAPAVEKIAFSDSDNDLRNHALSAVITLYAGTGDQRVGDRLARTVYDESASLQFRSRAYEGLFAVRGFPPSKQPRYGSVKKAFFEVVDWTFVDSFLLEDSENERSP